MEGWIKIHRKIKDHWLWSSDHRLKWWLDILLTVNYSDTKVLIKGNLIECKRGQSVRSLETWAKDWNVTKKTVKEFFELLQKDSMLVYESIKISTRITVCNYDSYQDVVNTTETISKRQVNAEYTEPTPKQECKEGIKNEKNEKNIPAFDEFKFYALENDPNVNLKSLELKYKSWVENGWRDGNDKKIINWKSKLLNTINYLNKNNHEKKSELDIFIEEARKKIDYGK